MPPIAPTACPGLPIQAESPSARPQKVDADFLPLVTTNSSPAIVALGVERITLTLETKPVPILMSTTFWLVSQTWLAVRGGGGGVEKRGVSEKRFFSLFLSKQKTKKNKTTLLSTYLRRPVAQPDDRSRGPHEALDVSREGGAGDGVDGALVVEGEGRLNFFSFSSRPNDEKQKSKKDGHPSFISTHSSSYLSSHKAPPRRYGLRVVLCGQERVDLVDERAFVRFLKVFLVFIQCFFLKANLFLVLPLAAPPFPRLSISPPPPHPHNIILPVTVLLGAVRAAAAIPVSAGGPNAKKALLPFVDVASDAGLSWLAVSEDAAEAVASSRAAPAASLSSTLGREERCEFFWRFFGRAEEEVK